MKINALREELNRLLSPEDGGRRPAVRRSLREDWIYATDLPAFTGAERLEAGLERLRAAGWECLAENGWIQLRKTVNEPPEGWTDGQPGPEAECCRSLLERHPERVKEPDQRIEYALIRAGEEGPAACETVCRQLHRDWAERLRKKEKLPEISLLYFEGGK